MKRVCDSNVAAIALAAITLSTGVSSARGDEPRQQNWTARLRGAIAQALGSEHAQHVADIAADVADAFYALVSLASRIEIVETSRRRLSEAAVSARERYRVGKGAQADVLRADLEKTTLDDRLANLRAERRSQAARFNTLQFLPAGT